MRLFLPLLLTHFLLLSCFAQDLPSRIRGYSVHKTPIVINDSPNAAGSQERTGVVKVGEPVLIDLSLTGVTFDLSGELMSTEQSGKVDFLTFHDFRVNGVTVKIEDYNHPFPFRKNESVQLPKPARVFLPTTGLIKTASKEIQQSDKEWTVTGRVFVFGKFRKYGFHHKRVVPVDVSLRIKNPLLQRSDS